MTDPSRPLWKRIYFQLGAGFFLLLILCCVIFVAAIAFSLHLANDRSHQIQHRDLARITAARLQPLLAPKLHLAELHSEFGRFIKLFPDMDLFLVYPDGSVADIYGEPLAQGARVSIPVIRGHLKDMSWVPERRLIKHPSAAGQTVFSAAPIVFYGKAGFLVITLRRHSLSPVEQILRVGALGWNSVFFALLLTLLATTVGLALFALLSRKFYELLRVVRSFEQGDYSARSKIESSNELGELSKAVNAMANRIEENIGELKGKDELRRRLVADICHDLRAPLGGMVSHADALKERLGDFSREQMAERLEGFVRSGEALTELVSQLFELSKLEAKETQPKLERCAPRELARAAELRFAGQAEQRGVELTMHAADDLPDVQADPALIGRVLDNLLANALRHTPKGGRIEIGLQQAAGGARFTVSDSGAGIDEAGLEAIFQPHVTFDNPMGMGLGLAILTKILELHEAEISVQSVKGRGSEFSFQLAACGSNSTNL